VAALLTATRARILAAGRRTRRGAVPTVHRSRSRRGACALHSPARACPQGTRACANFGGVTGFYIAGSVLAAWALLVSFLGVTRENFPASDRAARLVAAISILLVAAAIGSGIYLSATEEHEPEGEHAASG
jgi:hypothetical protein